MAGCSPSSHSIISDLFPKEKGAGALAIYSLGVPFVLCRRFCVRIVFKDDDAD